MQTAQLEKYGHLPGTLGKAVEARVEIGDRNMQELFSFISKHEGLSIYALSKKIGWSIGKTNYLLGKLDELDVIKKVQKIENNRFQLLIYPKFWHDSLPIESLKELKELMVKKGVVKG